MVVLGAVWQNEENDSCLTALNSHKLLKPMTSPEDSKFQPDPFQQELQRLEAEVNQTRSATSPSSQESASPVTKASQWLSELPQSGKVVVTVLAVVVGLAVISTVLQLVGLAIRLAVLAAIVYGIYRLLIAPKQN